MLCAPAWAPGAWTRWWALRSPLLAAVVAPDRSRAARCCPQVAAPGGEVIITNDGATILNKMTVTQPAAKMLVELAKSQVGARPGTLPATRGAGSGI